MVLCYHFLLVCHVHFVFSIPFPSPNQSFGFHVYICCVFASIYSSVKEDAIRAMEQKNGSFVDGWKIRVKLAMHRTPLEQR